MLIKINQEIQAAMPKKYWLLVLQEYQIAGGHIFHLFFFVYYFSNPGTKLIKIIRSFLIQFLTVLI